MDQPGGHPFGIRVVARYARSGRMAFRWRASKKLNSPSLAMVLVLNLERVWVFA